MPMPAHSRQLSCASAIASAACALGAAAAADAAATSGTTSMSERRVGLIRAVGCASSSSLRPAGEQQCSFKGVNLQCPCLIAASCGRAVLLRVRAQQAASRYYNTVAASGGHAPGTDPAWWPLLLWLALHAHALRPLGSWETLVAGDEPRSSRAELVVVPLRLLLAVAIAHGRVWRSGVGLLVH